MPPKQKITRDIRMQYDLYIEEIRGARPGRSYKVEYSRGEKISGQTHVTEADNDGNAVINFHAQFMSTLQKKTDVAYKKKFLKINVIEVDTGLPICSVDYNVGAAVVNESLQLKKMMARSDNGEMSLWFGIAGESEQSLQSQRSQTVEPEPEPEPEPEQATLQKHEEPQRNENVQKQQEPQPEAHSEEAEADAVVNDAIDAVESGRKSGNSSRRNTNASSPTSPKREARQEEQSPEPEAQPVAVTTKKERRDTVNAQSESRPQGFTAEESESASPTRSASTTNLARSNSNLNESKSQRTEPQAERAVVAPPAAAAPAPVPAPASQQTYSTVSRWLSSIADSVAAADPAKSTSIPRATLLILSALRRWRGEQRLVFVHDFVVFLYNDVLRHTRHFGQWVNTLIHVLYDMLSQVEALQDEAMQEAQEELEQAVADELLDILDDRSVVEGLQPSLITSGAEDPLVKLINSRIPIDDPIPPTLVVIISITIDDVLRRLCSIMVRKPMEAVTTYSVPPSQQPLLGTSDGYTLAAPVSANKNPMSMVRSHAVEDGNIAILIRMLDNLYTEIIPKSGCPPLLRLVTVEIFKIIMKNIAGSFMNNLTKKTEKHSCEFQIRTARDALNLKLSISLIERWLQEHQLYMTCRTEFLVLRQFCDVAILPKRALVSDETRSEICNTLPNPFLLEFLKQFQPNPRDTEEDIVPNELIRAVDTAMHNRKADLVAEKTAEYKASGKNATRIEIDSEASKEALEINEWTMESLGAFPFFDFVYGLLPMDEGAVDRKSTRMSVRKSMQLRTMNQSQSPARTGPGSKAENLALQWDVRYEYLATAEDLEALFPGITKDQVNLRLAALSIPQEELIDEVIGA